MKNLEITVRVTEGERYIDTEHCFVSVPSNVSADDFEKLFTALKQQHPDLYERYSDCTFTIDEVINA